MTGKKIAIVALGYAWLPGEKGPSRFYYLADMLAGAGYHVELIGSGFQHFEKKKRNIERLEKEKYPFKNVFIEVPPYKRNIDFRRIISNRAAARNVLSYLEKHTKPDLIYCAIPANNVAAATALFAKQNNIPFIVDIEDLWPEAMKMVMNIPLISNLAFYPMKRDAEFVYRNASAVIGTSEEYTNRAFQKRKREIAAETVYVGCNLEDFDRGVEAYSAHIRKDKNEFWAAYAGSIGTSYDIETVIRTAAEIQKEGYENIKFLIMGTGPLLNQMKQLCDTLGCRNVSMPGYVEYGRMAAVLKASDIVINSFIKGAPQSIVNKIGDYLASETAMINTLENAEFMKMVEEDGFGINIAPESAAELKGAVLRLYHENPLREKMAQNARKCAKKKFDRKESYQVIIKMMERLLKDERKQ